MATCARTECGRWRPDALLRFGRVGLRLDGAWYCSTACLALHAGAVLRAAHATTPWVAPTTVQPLGRVLIQQRAITHDDLRIALREQRTTGARLGRQLVVMGLTSREAVLRGLAAQAGVGYLTHIDATRVRRGPGGLSRDSVRALGVAPFELSRDAERLSVACAAPLPRVALAALREMTGAIIDAFVVDDELLSRLIEAYGTEESGERVDAATLASVDAAALHIAARVERDGAERMHHTRCDPFVWVRLEGQRRREDLLLPVTATTKEATWPVVLTSR
jgi:hypothetical protein